jgi:hypothetical protein
MAPAGATAAVLISDAFTTGATPRAVGDPLAGTAAEVGGVNWVGAGSLNFTAANEVATAISTASSHAFVSLAAAAPTSGKIFTIQADMKNVGVTYAKLMLSSTGANLITNVDLDVRLFANGNYRLDTTNTTVTIASGNVTPAAGLNTVQMLYNTGNNQASVWINGVNVVPWLNTGVVVSVAYAGIGNYGDAVGNAGTSTFDNFQVDVIPEPASLALLGLTGAGMILACRRKFKSR